MTKGVLALPDAGESAHHPWKWRKQRLRDDHLDQKKYLLFVLTWS